MQESNFYKTLPLITVVRNFKETLKKWDTYPKEKKLQAIAAYRKAELKILKATE
tara:strand:+ start:45 stop:206 length:162 start_codon:yes stop_codon:yes gene_type:complete